MHDPRFSARRLIGGLAAAAMLSGCGLVTSTNRAVFVLFDVSGTYAKAVPSAARSAGLLVSEMQPGDWIGVGQITSCSFSDKEIIVEERLPETPSLASNSKRMLLAKLKTYSEGVKASKFTDIRGALVQASAELRQRTETGRTIVVFSDMIEDHAKKCDTSKAPLDLKGITVVASNVIKSDPANPQKYFDNLSAWQKTVTDAGGVWRTANSPNELPKLVAEAGP